MTSDFNNKVPLSEHHDKYTTKVSGEDSDESKESLTSKNIQYVSESEDDMSFDSDTICDVEAFFDSSSDSDIMSEPESVHKITIKIPEYTIIKKKSHHSLTSNPYCQVDYCTTVATYSIDGDHKRIYCSKHALMHTNCVHYSTGKPPVKQSVHKCMNPICTDRAWYKTADSQSQLNKQLFCRTHAFEHGNCISIRHNKPLNSKLGRPPSVKFDAPPTVKLAETKTSARKNPCQGDGCTLTSNFALEGTTKPIFCHRHALEHGGCIGRHSGKPPSTSKRSLARSGITFIPSISSNKRPKIDDSIDQIDLRDLNDLDSIEENKVYIEDPDESISIEDKDEYSNDKDNNNDNGKLEFKMDLESDVEPVIVNHPIVPTISSTTLTLHQYKCQDMSCNQAAVTGLTDSSHDKIYCLTHKKEYMERETIHAMLKSKCDMSLIKNYLDKFKK